MLLPPFTLTTWPVTKPAFSLARYATIRDLHGRPRGRDVLELLRRLMVERLHPPAEQLAGTILVGAQAASHGQPEPRRCRTP